MITPNSVISKQQLQWLRCNAQWGMLRSCVSRMWHPPPPGGGWELGEWRSKSDLLLFQKWKVTTPWGWQAMVWPALWPEKIMPPGHHWSGVSLFGGGVREMKSLPRNLQGHWERPKMLGWGRANTLPVTATSIQNPDGFGHRNTKHFGGQYTGTERPWQAHDPKFSECQGGKAGTGWLPGDDGRQGKWAKQPWWRCFEYPGGCG